jgi:hypothetical protein
MKNYIKVERGSKTVVYFFLTKEGDLDIIVMNDINYESMFIEVRNDAVIFTEAVFGIDDVRGFEKNSYAKITLDLSEKESIDLFSDIREIKDGEGLESLKILRKALSYMALDLDVDEEKRKEMV